MGQARCQYLWVFEDTCIAVACDEGKESSCRPREVTKKFDSSVYVKVKHNPVDNELQKVLEWIKNYVPPTTEVGDYPPLANAGPKELTIKLPSSDMHIYLYGNKSKDDKVRPEALDRCICMDQMSFGSDIVSCVLFSNNINSSLYIHMYTHTHSHTYTHTCTYTHTHTHTCTGHCVA